MYSPNSDSRDLPSTVFSPMAGEPLGAPPLRGDHTADIVVIGGGITGVSAALHAAEKGASVILLEANAIGWGASGRNGGHVAPASKLTLEDALDRYGPIHGRRFNEACEAGPEVVFGLVERFGFDAEVQRGGVIVAAHSQAAVRELSHRAELLAREGKPVRFLDRREAEETIGSSLYLGAYFDRRGGSINSLAYVRGLARSAIGLGARIHEDTRALQMRRDGTRWLVETAQGRIASERIIICTNAYTDDLWPGLRRSIVPARSCHFATRPLPEEIRRTILPGAAVMTDKRRLLIGLRVTRDGRIHFNGYGPVVGPEIDVDVPRTIARLEEIFPQIAPVELDLDFRWSGWMAMSMAGTWKLHRLAPGVTAALGCNGRGVAMGTFLGRDLAWHAMGAPESDLTIPFEPMRPLPLHFVHPAVARTLAQYRDRLDIREMEHLRRQNAASMPTTAP